MDELTTVTAGAPATTLLAQAGQAANRAATRHLFAEYRQRKAANTIRRQDTDLALFAQYLLDVADIPTGDLSGDPQAWAGVTWGLVAGFAKWQLDQGYSIGSINVRLSTVKTYCKLAAQAGTLDRAEYAMILTVGGYKHKEGKHVDEIRHAAGTPTRKSTKKAQAILLTQAQAERMKAEHAGDGQGQRDRLMMCLLFDHGLRVGEVTHLTVEDFDLPAGELRFYRSKVDKTQTHRLSNDTLLAARAYFEHDASTSGPLLRASTRGGRLSEHGMSTRSITQRVRVLGKRLGVEGLSAHDARHYWAYLNRWIQPDTIIPDFANPPSFNRYSYVNNRPLNFVDPNGHSLWRDPGKLYPEHWRYHAVYNRLRRWPWQPKDPELSMEEIRNYPRGSMLASMVGIAVGLLLLILYLTE